MTSSVTVREATAADAPALGRLNSVVQRLHWEAFPERFHEPDETRVVPFYRQVLGADGSKPSAEARAWVCIDENDQALGYVLAVLRERPDNPFTKAIQWIELDQIAILDEARGQGAGRLLASEVVEWARDVDVDLLELSVWDFNEGPRAFFHAMGFEPLWHRQSVKLARNVTAP